MAYNFTNPAAVTKVKQLQQTAQQQPGFYNLPRQAPATSSVAPGTTTQSSPYNLPRQAPTQPTQGPRTQLGQIANQQDVQGLQTGNFADVQSARGATDRENALRTSQALQSARGTFARDGGDYNPEAAARAQDQAFSAAEAQNLNGTNAVNQLQRQYRTDAMGRAAATEAQGTSQQNADTNQAGTMGNLAVAQQNANTTATDVGNHFTLGKGSLANDVAKTGIDQQNADTSRIGTVGNLGVAQQNANTSQTDVGNHFVLGQGELAVNQAAQGTNQQNADTSKAVGLGNLGVAQQNAATSATDVGNRFALGQGSLANDVTRTGNELTLGNRAADTAQQNADTNKLDVTNRGSISQQELDAKKGEVGYQHTMDQINSIQDPKARQAAYNTYIKGGDVSQFISGTLYDSNGNLNQSYASPDPGQKTLNDTISELKATYPDKSDADIRQLAQTRLQNADQATAAPINTAVKTQDTESAVTRLDNGQGQPGDFETAVANGGIPKFTSQTLPIDEGAKALIGKTVSLNGGQYSVVASGRVGGGSDGTHRSYVVLQDPTGKIFYQADGKLSTTPPMDQGIGAPKEDNNGQYAVYDPTTKSVSYRKSPTG